MCLVSGPMLALLLLLLASQRALCWRVPLPSAVLHGHARSSARLRAKMARWGVTSPAAAGSRVFSPIDFGGDPTGAADSTAAVGAAATALLDACAPAARFAPVGRDCGGATLDLSGGEFLISAPLVFPASIANFRVVQGTLRASPSFPRDRYLIEVGAPGGRGVVDVALSELFLDASQVAAGCLLTNVVQGGVVGPQVYAFNFTQVGMSLNDGFELTVMQSWAGEFWYSDPRKENGTVSSAVGISKNSNDGDVIDVVVFSSNIGLVVNGEANYIEAVHTWNLANAHGGVGILVNRSQVRLAANYLDWNDVVFTEPTRVTFSDGIFLCGARIRLVAPPSGVADGISISANEFIGGYCHFSNYSAVEVDGAFSCALDVSVSGTLAEPGVRVRSPTATAVVASVTPTTLFTADFTAALLFDPAAVPITTVRVSLTADGGGVVAAVARPPVGGVVTVETAAPVVGSVVISVDQSARREGA